MSTWSSEGLAIRSTSATILKARTYSDLVKPVQDRQQLSGKATENRSFDPWTYKKDKTKRSQLNKERRNRLCLATERMKREKKMNSKIQIVTWNLQGSFMREQCRARLKSMYGFIAKQGREMTMISEISADARWKSY